MDIKVWIICVYIMVVVYSFIIFLNINDLKRELNHAKRLLEEIAAKVFETYD